VKTSYRVICEIAKFSFQSESLETVNMVSVNKYDGLIQYVRNLTKDSLHDEIKARLKQQ
jgi:hypothetical protein